MQPKVLIVNSNKQEAATLTKLLTKANCHVTSYAVKEIAADIVTKRKYDLIVVNPSANQQIGLEVIREATNKGINAKTFILGLCPTENAQLTIEMYWSGAADVVAIPIALEVFKAKLQAIISRIVINTKETQQSQRIKTKVHELEKDIELAAKNLSRFEELPEIPGLEIGVYSKAVHTIGGDFIAAYYRPNGAWAIVFGDIMGHGVQAAVLQPAILLILKEHLLKADDLSEILIDINNALEKKIPTNHFAAMCIMEWFPHEKYIRIFRHGTPYPMYYKRGAPGAEVPSNGSLLGIIPSHKSALTFEPWSTTLNAGDALVLTTDGITEAMREDGAVLQKTPAQYHLLRPDGRASHAAQAIGERLGAHGYKINDDALVAVLRPT